MGETHLEAPERIKILEAALKDAPFPIKYQKAVAATPKEILRLHSRSLFDLVKNSQSKGHYTFTPDTIANKFTYQAALTAVGGAIQTAMNLKNHTSFAMLRPPGHHSTKELAMGFCFFNNIALAAKHLLENWSRRIAIIDIDNHHGNGTQDLFYDTPDVLYASLHASPDIAYPSTGYASEVGVGDGEGYTVNIPLPFQTKDHDYLYAFDSMIIPIVKQFRPDTILVSLGFDSLLNDPYGALGLSVEGFSQLGLRIANLNASQTNNKVGVFLEGGYKYAEMGLAATNFFNALLNPQQFERTILSPGDTIQRIIFQNRAIQRNYWYAI